jgi:hypothetical protein
MLNLRHPFGDGREKGVEAGQNMFLGQNIFCLNNEHIFYAKTEKR